MGLEKSCVELAVILAVGLTLTTGCSDTSAPPSDPTPDQPVLKQYTSDDLPVVEYRLPPLDDGRIEIPVPNGWKALSRKRDFLTRFYQTVQHAPPRIHVTVEQLADARIDTATGENIDLFVEYVSQRVAGQLVPGEDLIEPCRGIVLGTTPWVRYVRGGRMANRAVERQFLHTIASGRWYTVELLVLRGTILRHRDTAYAVAAGMRVVQPEATSPDIAP